MTSFVAFIAYASEDGFEFACETVDWLRRQEPPVTAWIDRDNPADAGFDQRIENAIAGADVVLLVATAVSVAGGSWARDELAEARKWGKPIVVVRPPGSTVSVPVWAGTRSCIDIEPSRGGWTRLAHELTLLRTANGAVADQTERLLSLERQARTASDDQERAALQAQAGRESAARQEAQRRLIDPEGAVRAAADLIGAGRRADADRTPTTPTSGPFRTVGGPPTIAASNVHDRASEREALTHHLASDGLRIATMWGAAGAGKTALVSELDTALPNLGYVGRTYVSTHGPRRVTPELLLEQLAHVHSDERRTSFILQRLANPSYNWHQCLVETMRQFADDRVLVVIDNAEELVDADRLTDPHLREFANAVVNRPGHGLRLLLVSRSRGPTWDTRHCARVEIPSHLPSPYAKELLRDLDVGGTLGLRFAGDATLGRISALANGRPGLLELFHGILRNQHAADPDGLVHDASAQSADGVPQYLARRVVADLREPMRQTLQALAVFGRPVRSAAVSWLLAPYVPGLDSAKHLDVLRDQRIVRHDGDLYHFPADPDHAAVLETIPLGERDDLSADVPLFTRHVLWHRAAEYFRDVRLAAPPPTDPGGLAPHFAEIDLRLVGGEFAKANDVVKEIDEDFLRHWGYRSLVLRQRERMVGQLASTDEIGNRFELATIYLGASRPDEARTTLLGAMDLTDVHLPHIAPHLDQLMAKIDYTTGYLTESVRMFQTVARQQIGSDALARCRIGLAAALSELGDTAGARDQYAAALEVVAPGSLDEATARMNLGIAHHDLGTPLNALASVTRARELAKSCSASAVVAACDDAEAFVLLDTGRLHHATRLADSAIRYATDSGDTDLTREAYSTLGLARLLAGDVTAAHDAADAAARFFDNRRVLAPLTLLGVTQVRLGLRDQAENTFARAERETRRLLDIEPRAWQVLEAQGLALTGLALCDPGLDVEDACAAYRRARAVTSAPGIVLRAVRLLDELLDDERSSRATAVREAARGGGRM